MERTSTISNKSNTICDVGDIQTWTMVLNSDMVRLPSDIKSKIQNILKYKIKKLCWYMPTCFKGRFTIRNTTFWQVITSAYYETWYHAQTLFTLDIRNSHTFIFLITYKSWTIQCWLSHSENIHSVVPYHIGRLPTETDICAATLVEAVH